MAMALMLGVTRRIPEGLAVMQAGSWEGWAPTAFWARGSAGSGWAFSGWAGSGRPWRGGRGAFGMQIHYHNRHRLRPEIEETLEAT